MAITEIVAGTWGVWIGGKCYMGSLAMCCAIAELERAVRLSYPLPAWVRRGLEAEFGGGY